MIAAPSVARRASLPRDAGSSLITLLTPAETCAAGARCVGGKAWGLAALEGAGVHVPPWRVLPAGALAERLVACGVAAAVHEHLAEFARWAGPTASAPVAARDTADALAALLAPLTAGPAVEAALADAARALLAERAPAGLTHGFAVRSSAAGEDGDRHSFAGQLDSVLGPADAPALARAVVRCWRSAFSTRALDYRRRAGTLADAARVGIVVQRLVAADAAGVLFTADPHTGRVDRMRASACPGLGEALVAGRHDADEFLLDARNGRVLEARVAHKARRVIIAGDRTREADVPAALRDAPALDAATLAALAEAGRRVARHAGAPRDVEWATAGETLWVVQARAVTAAAPALGADGPATVWDNSNIQESYAGVTTPLTFSFASAAYASVYAQTMRAAGIPERTVAAHRPLLAGLLGLLRGRVYYNLGHWYQGLRLLPAFRRNKADMERMMGVDEPVDFVVDDDDWRDALRRLPGTLRALAGLARRFATLDRDARRFLVEFNALAATVDRDALSEASFAELMTHLDRLWREGVERWTTPIVNDFRVMTCAGRLRRLVARATPGRADALLHPLLGGADVAASAGPALLLLGLSDVARADAAVARALQLPDPAAALAAARAASPAFDAGLGELFARYGDRGMGELKLESRALRDDPAFVVRVLANYAAMAPEGAPPDDATRLAADAATARARAEREVAAACGPLGRVRFARALAAARRAIRAREAMRLARTRLFGLHRDLYRAVGARLCALGRLDAADDVFYLTVDEVAAYWAGRAPSCDLAALARARRAEFAEYAREPAPPDRVVTYGSPDAWLRAHAGGEGQVDPRMDSRVRGNDGVRSGQARTRGNPRLPDDTPDGVPAVLRGLGCSPGVAVGRVRVVAGPDADLAIAGHVLVAPRTDPGWAPLFPSAAAIVVERGGLLSHSAVLARELGLPAVVGVPGVMALLRDGELVRVDGAAGTVERLEPL